MNHQTLFNSGIQFHVEQKTNVKRNYEKDFEIIKMFLLLKARHFGHQLVQQFNL